jgi:Siphovirus-type tail component, C-terminal domain
VPILVAPSVGTPLPPNVRPTEVTWTSTAGRVTVLTGWRAFDGGVILTPGALGFGMPTFTAYEDVSPIFDGSVVRGIRADPKDVTVPLHIWGPDRAACLDVYHRLVFDLNPKNGAGMLTVTESGGTSRTAEAWFLQGFEGNDDDSGTGRHWLTAALVFRVPSPYWTGNTVTLHWTAGVDPGSFYPILPWEVHDDQVLGALTILNIGDVDAFPQWTVTGPATVIDFTVTRADGSTETLHIDRTIGPGDVIVIDTREGQQTVVLNGATNLWPYLTIDSALWSLTPGSNQVSLQVEGATDESVVQLQYAARYLTAY